MNRFQGFYEELTGDREEPKAKPEPKDLPAALAWFDSLDLENLPPGDNVEAEFYKNAVIVYRTKKDDWSDGNSYYLITKSPQQKAWSRRSLGTTQGYGAIETIRGDLERWVEKQEAKIAKRKARTAAKRKARAAFKNPYKVGDVLYSSWGYDQTNREFYQVLEVRPTSLKVRRIAMKSVEATGPFSENVAAVRDAFLADWPARWITIQVHKDGQHHIVSPDYPDSSNLYLWDGDPLHSSWGH